MTFEYHVVGISITVVTILFSIRRFKFCTYSVPYKFDIITKPTTASQATNTKIIVGSMKDKVKCEFRIHRVPVKKMIVLYLQDKGEMI
jgi:hypothetical protein